MHAAGDRRSQHVDGPVHQTELRAGALCCSVKAEQQHFASVERTREQPVDTGCMFEHVPLTRR
ncbi:hypothetical protein D3C83_293250 [compost metagenome]